MPASSVSDSTEVSLYSETGIGCVIKRCFGERGAFGADDDELLGMYPNCRAAADAVIAAARK